jgi:FMN phosphatase YigB (HAD superfamily)
MKILSDFDGVLTDISHETIRARALFEGFLFNLFPLARREIQGLIDSVVAEMEREPHRHGWRSNGRITAFANEDGFIFVNGLGACLDEWSAKPSPMAAEVLLALKHKGLESFSALSQHAYSQMARETSMGKRRPMDGGSEEGLRKLIDRGHEVVVVSNSSTDRIRGILEDSILSGFLREGSQQLRIRGDAQKFILGPSTDEYRVGPYAVALDRPHYHSILLDEKPDVVVGDVFSLDLALACALREQNKLPQTRIFLRRRYYTPTWSRSFFAGLTKKEKSGGILERFDELVDMA